jgi:hypothetical protein
MKGDVKRYHEIIENVYRNREQAVRDCAAKGGNSSAATWFMSGGVSVTLNTAPTPESGLRDRIQNTLAAVTTVDGGKVKVIETRGVPISVGFKKNDPFRLESCDFNDPECIVDNKTSCGTMSACYQILCSSGDTVPEETHPLTLIQGEEVATVQPKGGGELQGMLQEAGRQWKQEIETGQE